MRKLKVLIDARLAGRSGIGLYLSFLLPGFLRNPDFQLTLLVREKGTFPFPVPDSVSIYESKASPFSARSLCGLNWINFDCDVAWFPHFCVPFGFSKPFVATIHDLLPLDVPTSIDGWHAQLVTRLLYANVARRAQQIIVPTKFTLERFSAHFPNDAKKTVQIYNPFSFAHFVETAANIPIHAKPTLPEKYALFVGNLKQHKRSDLAHRYALKNGLALVIVGALTDVLRSSIGKIDSKHGLYFLGGVDDLTLIALIKNAKVVLHTSEYEGYGYVPALALSLGTFTICNRIPAIEEVYGSSVGYFDTHASPDHTTINVKFRQSDPATYVDQVRALLTSSAS